MSLPTKPEGNAFDTPSPGMWFADAIEQAGLTNFICQKLIFY